MYKLIDEEVDIYQLPAMDVLYTGHGGTEITMGDLHGNAMKLMFMLVKHGIATNINEADYSHLVAIYKTRTQDLTKQHLGEFNDILSKIKFNTDALVRLIGDELADRGNNDYFTLKILEKLHEHNVPVEILVSNHSIDFITAYEKQNDFHASSMGFQAPSMENLQTLVEKQIVTREEILAIAEKNYKPSLRALSYSLSDDQKEITIYSHAGIGLNTIKALAKKLNVRYNDATASELAQTIDSINARFQQHVQNNTVNTLYTEREMYSGDLNNPFIFILWNRHYEHIDRPVVHFGYKINFVHGHDSYDMTTDNIYNLDNRLGKRDFGQQEDQDDSNQGRYTIFYSKKDDIAPTMELIEKEEIGVKQSAHAAPDIVEKAATANLLLFKTDAANKIDQPEQSMIIANTQIKRQKLS